jgi:hypothetical protein
MPREDREPDELFEIRTNFYTGNYQQAINEATKLKVCFIILNSIEIIGSLSGSTKFTNGKRFIHVSVIYSSEKIWCGFG